MVVYLHLVCWNFIIAKNIQAQVFGKFPDRNTVTQGKWWHTDGVAPVVWGIYQGFTCGTCVPPASPSQCPTSPPPTPTHTWGLATQLGKMTLIQIDSVRRHCAVYFILHIVQLVVYLYLCISTVQCVHVGGGGGSWHITVQLGLSRGK